MAPRVHAVAAAVVVALGMTLTGPSPQAVAIRPSASLPAGPCAALLHLRLPALPSGAALLDLLVALCSQRDAPPPTPPPTAPSTSSPTPPLSSATGTAPPAGTTPPATLTTTPGTASAGPARPVDTNAPSGPGTATPADSHVVLPKGPDAGSDQPPGEDDSVAVGPWTASPGSDSSVGSGRASHMRQWALTVAILLLAFSAMMGLLWRRNPPRDEE